MRISRTISFQEYVWKTLFDDFEGNVSARVNELLLKGLDSEFAQQDHYKKLLHKTQRDLSEATQEINKLKRMVGTLRNKLANVGNSQTSLIEYRPEHYQWIKENLRMKPLGKSFHNSFCRKFPDRHPSFVEFNRLVLETENKEGRI